MKTETFNKIVDRSLKANDTELYDKFVSYASVLHHGTSNQEQILAARSMINLCADFGLETYSLSLRSLAIETLVNKAKEYATGGDRLWNFKNNYPWQDDLPKVRLLGYMEKHLVSCADILSGRTEKTEYLVKEKFGDVLVYCILLIALLEETND